MNGRIDIGGGFELAFHGADIAAEWAWGLGIARLDKCVIHSAAGESGTDYSIGRALRKDAFTIPPIGHQQVQVDCSSKPANRGVAGATALHAQRGQENRRWDQSRDGGFAADLPRLQELRCTLHQRMERSPLMDAPRFARNIEAAYRQMWRGWCERTLDRF